jgi:hypothetical protein
MQNTCNSVNGKSGTAWQPRIDAFLLGCGFFHSTPGPQTRLPGTRNAVHRFPVPLSRQTRPAVPAFPYRVPVSRLDIAISNRLKVYCADCASKSLRVQAGGAGVRRRVRVFLYYHHTPHNFFRHKRLTARLPAGVAPRAWYRMREAVIEDRSVCVALCSVRYA